MSGKCDACGNHTLECIYIEPCRENSWYETEEYKKQLLDSINEMFFFGIVGNMFCHVCKNEYIACVCLDSVP